jgi:hypothetical protein
MGMRYVVQAIGRVGLLGDDLVGASAADLLPGQHDPERAQVHTFQHDRRGEHADRALLEVQLDLVEFLFQGGQIRRNLARRSDVRWRPSRQQLVAKRG